METITYKLEQVVRGKEGYEDFEGPLDLILFFLAKDKIAIKDIRISDILEQYLRHLQTMRDMDLEVASEFVAMAAHLVYIKTKMLLSADEDETREEMEQLILSLEERSKRIEYRTMQFVAEYLSSRAEIGRALFVKLPESIEPDQSYGHLHNTETLPQAIFGIRLRTKQKLPPPLSSFRGIVGKEPYPVASKYAEIIQRFVFTPITKFRQLILNCTSRSEIVATFLAVLELCKENQADVVEQESDFEIISKNGPAGVYPET